MFRGNGLIGLNPAVSNLLYAPGVLFPARDTGSWPPRRGLEHQFTRIGKWEQGWVCWCMVAEACGGGLSRRDL